MNRNLCTLGPACLLIEDGQLILIDNGLGNKQDQNSLAINIFTARTHWISRETEV